MSTFDGIVSEFPEIQIDYFRKGRDKAPLACFLSHVHSDHLQGLESFRAPFIYCSPATRELLLRIEKYPHRMNFQKGILESRRLHYKHLAKILRPIPLNTPTDIELTPKKHVRVTLLDANHCAGAVMFLIEGDGKSILYTGDIRAEKWWTNALVRHPIFIPYSLGRKRLDKIYLDTTFASSSNPLRKFPSKAQGLAELLQKVAEYPQETTFYFRSWTFGYEEVWLALSAALNTKIHLDRYQLGLYRALMNTSGDKCASEAAALCGFDLGHRFVKGCLSDDESSRIHSCEPGVSCKTALSPNTVYITPIVNRTPDGAEIPEVGAGGGAGDLYQVHELELPDESALKKLENLCAQHITDPGALSNIRAALSEAFQSKKKTLSLDQYGVRDDEIPLEQLATKLGDSHPDTSSPSTTSKLPNSIRFPYSRHSSYSELCDLVAALKPKDIHPCTVDASSWCEAVSMRSLFGHLCSGDTFAHDTKMRENLDAQYDEIHRARKRARYDDDISTQSSVSSVTGEPTPTKDKAHQTYRPITSSIPDRAQMRRDEIQKAHRYLSKHADPDLLHVDSLPSSCITDAEKHDLVAHDPKNGDDMTIRAEGEDKPHSPPHLSETQNTDSLTLPISESIISPSSPIDADTALVDTDSGSEAQGSDLRRGAGRRRVMARLRGRISAYLAAQEGTYAAWEDHSLVTAGANHTEEEKEL